MIPTLTLYAPNGSERDALYVLTPDVMAAMIDVGQDFDIEVIDDKLHLFHEGHLKLADPNELSRLFSIIEIIRREVGKQAGQFSGPASTSGTYSFISQNPRLVPREKYSKLNMIFALLSVFTGIALAVLIAIMYR